MAKSKSRPVKTRAQSKAWLKKVIAVMVMVAIIATGAGFGIWKLKANTPESDEPQLMETDGTVATGAGIEKKDETEPTSGSAMDYTIKLSRAEANKMLGDMKTQYVLESSFSNMKRTRSELTDIDDAVSIPFAMKQADIDAIRNAGMSEKLQRKALLEKLDESVKEFKKLKGDDLEFAVRNMLKEEIMLDPIFGDMVGKGMLKNPEIAEQNPWLVEFIANMDESYARAKDDIPDDEQLVGIEAWIHAEDAEAEKNEDTSRMLINDADNPEKGQYDYFYPAAKLWVLVDQCFRFEGRLELTSSVNYHLPKNGDAATQRTKEADDQESGAAFVFYSKDKNGKVDMRIGFNDQKRHGDRRFEIFEEEPKVVPNDEPEPVPEDKDTPDKATLTVRYVFEDGRKAADTYSKEYYVGSRYKDVISPLVDGYTPDRDRIKGGTILEDINEVVTYYDNDVTSELHKAVIRYWFKGTGETAAPPFEKKMKPGESVTRQSPKLTGYTPDQPSVTIRMGHKDVVVDVYYTKKPDENPDYKLTVMYQFEDGTRAAATHVEYLKEDEPYKVISPKVTNATPSRAVVEGKMPNHNLTIIVIYKKLNLLTVNYVVRDGLVSAPPTHSERLYKGQRYYVSSPSLKDYKPSLSVVSGTMPDHDVTVTIYYDRKDGHGKKDPEEDPDKRDEFDPGIGDNAPSDSNGGSQGKDEPANNDKVNGGTSKPGDNANPDGKDPTKPATPPTADDAKKDTTGKDENGNSQTVDDKVSNGEFVDSDPEEQSVERPSAKSVAPTEPLSAAEPQSSNPAPAAEAKTATSSEAGDGAGQSQAECPI